MPHLPAARKVRTTTGASGVAALDHASARTICDDRVQAEDGNRGSKTNLRATLADRRVPARLDQRALRSKAVPLPRPPESNHGSYLGLSKLQPDEMVRPKADTASNASVESFNGCRKVCGRGGCRKTETLQVTVSVLPVGRKGDFFTASRRDIPHFPQTNQARNVSSLVSQATHTRTDFTSVREK